VPTATTAVIWLVMLCKNLLFVMSNPPTVIAGLVVCIAKRFDRFRIKRCRMK
jgi:hypothetical protein